ncbi:L,D-transpeptidase family protein [Solitalea lacus]|uniref:L,D-transpeptidase family protein n=1 Tax=Solitalea lacus TaxID=2911172 RepID=UPI001EDC49F0|nr:L,D-transpeptidase family protein [Solitalea lacus]UKJ06720.1 L,D-transpeptidase family protein [Solitalea lacus]
MKRKVLISPYTILFIILAIACISPQLSFIQHGRPILIDTSDVKEKFIQPLLIDKFYQQNHQKLFWFSTDEKSVKLRQQLLDIIENRKYLGLDKENYHANELRNHITEMDCQKIFRADWLFTDAALSYAKDIYTGAELNYWVSYDQISEKCAVRDYEYLLAKLLAVKSAEELDQYFKELEPKSREYLILKNELNKKLNDTVQVQKGSLLKKLISSINFYRWIHHFQLDKFVVVNIGSTTLSYYENDSVKLNMKIVVGKPSTKTPRFVAYCNEVILYPYWNVPHSIAVNELLPLFKFRPSLIEGMNMQIIDKNGNILNPDSIKWISLNKSNFPYKFRQSTGCDNALGVIKFNLTSPFSVYMHDTNLKTAFKLNNRYLSHGCIRLEKPMELGNYLLKDKLDTTFLSSCLKDQKPVSLPLEKPVTVFVVYMTAEASRADSVEYHKDVYLLLK